MSTGIKFYVQNPADLYGNVVYRPNWVIEASEIDLRDSELEHLKDKAQFIKENIKVIEPEELRSDYGAFLDRRDWIECSGPVRKFDSPKEYIQFFLALRPDHPISRGFKKKLSPKETTPRLCCIIL